jgi:hypothetical protein
VLVNVLAVVILARLGRRLFGTTHELTYTRPATVKQAPSADRARPARIVPLADASGEAMLAAQEEEPLTRVRNPV